MTSRHTLLAIALAALFASMPASADTIAPPPAGHSLIGTKLHDPAWSAQTVARLEQDVEIARAVLAVAPDREDSWIWLGRRLAYLNRFEESIAVFTQGLERFPDSYKMLRFRGRKLARSRMFDAALADYTRGIELMEGVQDSYEPDGIQNARNQYLGSYRSNFHYYRAQVYWGLGDYASALVGMERSASEPLVQNNDHKVAVVYWRYLILTKLGRKDEAKQLLGTIPGDLVLLENDGYYDGVKYAQGKMTREAVLSKSDAISSFVVAMEDLFAGKHVEADTLLEKIIRDSAQGFWPAETELLALRSRKPGD